MRQHPIEQNKAPEFNDAERFGNQFGNFWLCDWECLIMVHAWLKPVIMAPCTVE